MAEKTFLEIFNKYKPYGTEIIAVLSRAGKVENIRADKAKRLLQAEVHFEQIVHKNLLYTIENEIKEAYSLNNMKILPKYPAELFDKSYFAQILVEAERVGVVAKGFFGGCDYVFEGDTIVITIPFAKGGLDLLKKNGTPAIIENIIFSEFGIKYNVKVVNDENMTTSVRERQRSEVEKLDRQLVEENKRYESGAIASGDGAPKNEKEASALDLPRVSTLGEVGEVVNEGDSICTIGYKKFDISNPEYVFGEEFEINPTPIAKVEGNSKYVVIVGEVFDFVQEQARRGNNYSTTFAVYDGNTSIEVRAYKGEEESRAIADAVKNGQSYALYGYAKHEKKKDGTFDRDLVFTFSHIAKINEIKRMDNAEEKRVELHLHTQMSAMDALLPPDVAVKKAHEWGHRAVAITDHGNVQAYQMAMLSAEKLGMKVLYGMEAYFVNDKTSAVTGDYKGTFADEFVVFDIETTGLSVLTSQIIEIGAVKIKDGKVLERFNKFVNPGVAIPENITELTGIDDSMVADADKIDVVLREFLDFIGNRLLIAHNANFDVGFIRKASRECGYEYKNPYLDTVTLSRFLNPNLKSHKLDAVAKYYDLGDFNHHRACDDAEMLANIFFSMVEQMDRFDIKTFADLQRDMSENANPLTIKPYHQVILVKNPTGLKNLYKLISYSYLKYYRRMPRIPKSELEKHREGLILGSACEAGELFRAILEKKPEDDIREIVNFYDYLEIQPISNNRFLIDEGTVANDDDLRELNRQIVELGEKYKKPVVATCDVHYLNPDDEIGRKVLLAGMRFKDADRDCPLYFRTTEEMLEEFSYLGKEKAYEVVIKNPNLIADMVEDGIRPFPKGTFTPKIEGAEEDLQRICYENAEKKYGKPLPEYVRARLDKELTSIIKNGFAVLYIIAQKLVKYSEDNGYLVGSRGSVGSSFVASCAGISEVNPLKPHYYCPNCQHSEFFMDGEVGSGFDLPDKNCPECNTKMCADGHDIPFETFLGFYGEKSPDIDLNFSGEVQGKVHKYTEELFGAENVFRAGTIGGIADKTAYGFVLKYLEEKGISLPRAEMNRLVAKCVGVKRTTGQHPGGIVVVPKEMEIYDFCPVQHPAEDASSNIVTTHFTFEYLHDTLLKLDELGHDIPTKYKWIERFSNTSVMDVPMNDPAVYELFLSTNSLGINSGDIGEATLGTYGLPEFGTRFVMRMVEEAKPKSFADLLQISGLSHGTDVWTGNAQDLISGVAEGLGKGEKLTISQVIGCRDNIMNDLIAYGVDSALSFKIMESVRKGKGLTPEWESAMLEAGVPTWYINSCKKIKYMFPKAHAAAYVMSAIRVAWYKVHMPVAFYCAMFTVSNVGLDAEIVMRGHRGVSNEIKRIEELGKEASQKEQASVAGLQLVREAYARGIKFLPIDLKKSDKNAFLPENGGIRLPFSSLSGLGENAAQNIIDARNEEEFFSIEDLQIRAKLSGTVIEILRKNGVLDGLSDTDQISFF